TGRSEAPAPPPQANGRGGHFRHPGRWWQPCVTPYFADLGVGDMRGARASNIHRHPGGGGRLSVTTKRSIFAKQRQMTKDGHFRHPGGGGSRA
ncbi:MAG: hypothetical protein SO127_05725, partial [Muribaculaceae bacterium]|nr:hypothetical protein [Muribaculaceae bacterium]